MAGVTKVRRLGGGTKPNTFVGLCRALGVRKLIPRTPTFMQIGLHPPKMKAIPSRVCCAYLQGLTMVRTVPYLDTVLSWQPTVLKNSQ